MKQRDHDDDEQVEENCHRIISEKIGIYSNEREL